LTTGGQGATAHFRLLEGGAPPIPDHCPVPCKVRVAPGTNQEVLVTASGYYPARFQLSYEAAILAKGVQGDVEPKLIIPLKARRPISSTVKASASPLAASLTEGEDRGRIEERLGNLAVLRHHGLISEKEYTERRARILEEVLGK